MNDKKQYTNEELGIDPESENRTIRLVIGTMIVLLVLGFILMIAAFVLDFMHYEEPQPANPPPVEQTAPEAPGSQAAV